jgi:membrane-bound metal-dependent hydrolase YbcI (DUF457 family)
LNFKNHAIGGLVSGTIVAGVTYYFSKNAQVSFSMGAVTLAGSLLSDCDTGSIPSRIFAWLGVIFSIYLIYIKQPIFSAIIGIIYMSLNLDHHRGFTHKWIVPTACFIGAYFSKQAWPIALGVGVATHLSLDKIPPWKII